MRQQQSTILYLFIILLILAGLGLFIFKNNVADLFLNYDTSNLTYVPRTAVGNDLKLDILRDSRIKSLKNYISVFDYENLDNSQKIILENYNKSGDVVISNPNENATSTTKATTTSTSLIRVRVGNSNPFLIKKVAK